MIFLKKVNIGKNVSIYPMPVTLVGSKVEEKPNFMTVAWITRVNAAPPMLAVSLNKPRYTAKGIRENKTFSVNFPKVDMAEQTDYCGLKTAPMIKSCPLSFECMLMDIIELPTNDLFIGEIVNGYADEQSFTEGELDVHKINPLLLTMPDNRYWSVGDYVGDAWSIGGRQGKLSEK
jgi:flavin reductase (DIM6/NTAB) family NADH-FMN oxidoreductase RutF